MAPLHPSREIMTELKKGLCETDEESMLLVENVEGISYSSMNINKPSDDSTVILTPSSSVATWEEDLSDEEENGEKSSCMRIWEIYYSWLERYPLLVKSLTALVLMGFADALAQFVENLRGLHEGKTDNESSLHFLLGDWDWLRMLRFAIFGLVGAPWTHYYYDWLDRVLPPTQNPWTMTTAVKVVIDQFLQAPALLALIIMGLAFMEGRGLDGMRQDMEEQYCYSLIQNWKLWIPATIVNIAFVKPTLRVLFDNVIFLVWTIYLSMILNGHNTDR